jgi:hypothetical protein
MNLRRLFATSLLTCAVLITISVNAFAQSSQGDKKYDDTNLDTQLYLLIATNQDVDGARLPAVLDPAIKQLRASLPFKNYRLAWK